MKKEKYNITQETSVEVIRFAKVLGVVVICILGFYLFTKAFVTKDLFKEKKKDDEIVTVDIDYNVTTLGSLFNRPYKEYYVLAYDAEDKLAGFYATIMNKYKSSEDSIKIYYANLATPFNKSFIAEDISTPSATKASELKVKGVTLIKINDGKIVKFIEEKDKITEELKVD